MIAHDINLLLFKLSLNSAKNIGEKGKGLQSQMIPNDKVLAQAATGDQGSKC